MSNYDCALIGIADFFKYKNNFDVITPRWMSKEEFKAWSIGFRYAEKNLVI